MKDIRYSIAKSYTKKPGPRYNWQGKNSGQDFLETVLLGLFDSAKKSKCHLIINLDSTVGYGSSFLEEAFGGLVRARDLGSVKKYLRFISKEEAFLIDEINQYINEAGAHKEA